MLWKKSHYIKFWTHKFKNTMSSTIITLILNPPLLSMYKNILEYHWHLEMRFKWEMIVRNVVSLHGIVRPPIGWSNPYSSSAFLNNSWNNGCSKYDIGTTNFLCFLEYLSPTYTAICPFGISFFVRTRTLYLACRIIALIPTIPIVN